MNNTLKIKTPIFIPKISDTKLFDEYEHIPAILMEAHHTEWHPNLLSSIRNKVDFFILDPATYRIMFKSAREIPSFKKLPYYFDLDLQRFYSDTDYRNNNFLIPCIKYQIEKDSDIIIAPYLFSRYTEGPIFAINITMISESIRYLTDNSINKPLFAMITLDCNVLEEPTSINYLIERYVTDFENYINGYFILIDSLDCKKIDPKQILGLAKMVKQLSENKYVFLKQIGGFGEILCGIGASGFISGLYMGETFSLKYLERKREGFGTHNRIFIPELFTYVNEEVAKDINYKCQCSFCNGSLQTSTSSKKKHYFTCKTGTTNDLQGLNNNEKLNYLLDKINKALKFSSRITVFSNSYLNNWRRILESSRNWSFTKKDEIDLEELLNDLESEG